MTGGRTRVCVAQAGRCAVPATSTIARQAPATALPSRPPACEYAMRAPSADASLGTMQPSSRTFRVTSAEAGSQSVGVPVGSRRKGNGWGSEAAAAAAPPFAAATLTGGRASDAMQGGSRTAQLRRLLRRPRVHAEPLWSGVGGRLPGPLTCRVCRALVALTNCCASGSPLMFRSVLCMASRRQRRRQEQGPSTALAICLKRDRHCLPQHGCEWQRAISCS